MSTPEPTPPASTTPSLPMAPNETGTEAAPASTVPSSKDTTTDKVAEASTSTFSSFFDYVKTSKIAQGGQWLAAKGVSAAYTGGVKAAAGTYLWATGYNEQSFKKEIASELSEIGKKEKMPQFASAVDSVAETVEHLLATAIDDETLKSLIQSHEGELKGFIKLTILKIFHNIEQYPLAAGEDPSDILGRVIVRLLHLANTHLPKIHQGLAACEAITDPVERRIQMSHLFYPLAHDFSRWPCRMVKTTSRRHTRSTRSSTKCSKRCSCSTQKDLKMSMPCTRSITSSGITSSPSCPRTSCPCSTIRSWIPSKTPNPNSLKGKRMRRRWSTAARSSENKPRH